MSYIIEGGGKKRFFTSAQKAANFMNGKSFKSYTTFKVRADGKIVRVPFKTAQLNEFKTYLSNF